MKGPPEMCEPRFDASSSTSAGGNNSYQNKSIDFSDYMWMGEEEIEDFDKKCEDEFWEDFLMEQAYEQMLAEEEEREGPAFPGGSGTGPESSVADGNPGNTRASARYAQQPPQPQRISDLERHMAELNVNSNNAHFQGRYNPRPRMCNPQVRWQNQERRQNNRQQMPQQHRHQQQQQQQHQHQMPPRGDNYSHMQPQVQASASQPHHYQQQQQQQQHPQHVIVSAVGVHHHGLSAAMLPRLNPDAAVFIPRAAFVQPVPFAAQQHSLER